MPSAGDDAAYEVHCCYSCGTNQIQAFKKSRKMSCKQCGAKQSMTRPLGKADDPALLRPVVAALNAGRGVNAPESNEIASTGSNEEASSDPWAELEEHTGPRQGSKWQRFFQASEARKEDCGEEEALWFEKEDPLAKGARPQWWHQS